MGLMNQGPKVVRVGEQAKGLEGRRLRELCGNSNINKYTLNGSEYPLWKDGDTERAAELKFQKSTKYIIGILTEIRPFWLRITVGFNHRDVCS